MPKLESLGKRSLTEGLFFVFVGHRLSVEAAQKGGRVLGAGTPVSAS